MKRRKGRGGAKGRRRVTDGERSAVSFGGISIGLANCYHHHNSYQSSLLLSIHDNYDC